MHVSYLYLAKSITTTFTLLLILIQTKIATSLQLINLKTTFKNRRTLLSP